MEHWDLYNDRLNNTGKVISSNSQIPEGYYHLTLEIWVINKEKN